MLIVGSGFAGLGAAIRLDRAGVRDFLVIERGSEVGGTWRDNTYPGAACDVPSQLYSFSFALESRLVAGIPTAAGDPGLSTPDRRRIGHPRPASLRLRHAVRALGSRCPALDRADQPGDAHRGHPGDCIRWVERAEDAGTTRYRTVRGAAVPYRPLGPRRRTRRQTGRRDRHRRVRRSRSFPRSPTTSVISMCSSERRHGSCRGATTGSPACREPLSAGFPDISGCAAR